MGFQWINGSDQINRNGRPGLVPTVLTVDERAEVESTRWRRGGHVGLRHTETKVRCQRPNGERRRGHQTIEEEMAKLTITCVTRNHGGERPAERIGGGGFRAAARRGYSCDARGRRRGGRASPSTHEGSGGVGGNWRSSNGW
ncbi:hypothetical protein E2562_027359 [Oryza meyeriana var. granulata]|uniref:Uncharacterized protein n=1 Tax=Oryza meyeriana var. granulata TaxID=110450 RepID=A0A6G1C986_9ORYZ|nr:hypothetical protein E2562_027359 [Oryza meyeriana var. granulata]